MHDPMTVAFEIRYPWVASRTTLKSGRVIVHRDAFITIWHVDPERDGSDDSCGWSRPHLSERQRDRLKHFAWEEGRHPYFLRSRSKEWTGTRLEAEAIYRGLLLKVAACIGIPMTFDEAAKRAALAIHDPEDGIMDAAAHLCFLPGYHSNFETDSADDRERHFAALVGNIARWMVGGRRPWWRHPRWHVWHWRVQVRPLQQLRRWLFERCGQCGQRFGWNEAPVTYSWSGNGPRFHQGCTSSYERDSAIERVIAEAARPPAHTPHDGD